MSEMQQVISILGAMNTQMGEMSKVFCDEIRSLEKCFDEKLEAMEKRFDEKLEAMEKRFDEKLEAMEKRFDEKLEAMEKRFDEKLEALEKRFDAKFQELKEEIKLLEFGLGTEIEKVYLIVVDNQKQIAGLQERINTVEKVLATHSEEIRNIKHAIA